MYKHDVHKRTNILFKYKLKQMDGNIYKTIRDNQYWFIVKHKSKKLT